jgi:prepilin-type N-terminal cleavage/methylation domain-containing protein
MRNGYKAFTIIEVTIAMLLSSIVVLIGYSSFTLIRRSYDRFNQRNNRDAAVLLADHLLKRDLFRTARIVKTETGMRCISDSATIDYSFTGDYMVRSTGPGTADTVRLKLSEPQMMFGGELSPIGELVDAVRADVEIEGKRIPLIAVKIYSAQELFNP